MPKIVLAGATPWPRPNGLMHRFGDVLDVSDEQAGELRDLGLVLEDSKSGSGKSEAESATVDNTADTESSEPDMPVEPAAGTGKKYPALPKKSASVNVWREYARSNDIDIRGLSDAAEIKGHIMKVVGGE